MCGLLLNRWVTTCTVVVYHVPKTSDHDHSLSHTISTLLGCPSPLALVLQYFCEEFYTPANRPCLGDMEALWKMMKTQD